MTIPGDYKTLMLMGTTTTTTTTTAHIPVTYPNVIIPNNSGITDFRISNPYIHYEAKQQGDDPAIRIDPSGYLTLAPILFNYYNSLNRNGVFLASTTTTPSPLP